MSARSLRLRLFAVAALSIAVALAMVALLTRGAARQEFRVFEVSQGAARAREAAATLSARIGVAPDAARLDAALATLSRELGRALVVLGPTGELRGASAPGLRAGGVRVEGGRLLIEHEVRRAGVLERRRMILAGAPQAEVRDVRGASVGSLVLLPPDPGAGGEGRPPFGAAFDLRLLLAALGAAAVALALSWALSRRVLGPVEALTAAAGRLGRGDWSARVVVRGADELAELSRAFNAMAADLARQESLRRTLMSDVAHELRTPLTNLRAQLEAVEDGLLAPAPETLRSLREEVLLLARLVEDLQTLAVAEAGRLALDRAAAPVRELAEGAIEAARALAAERGVALANRVGEVPPVDADPVRIGQVLRNLLVNAITHTPAGGHVEVAAVAGADGVTVSVCDDGEGIAPGHLAHVFDRFYRADPSRARATGGAGLGLAIVKGIVEAHGGRVGAESEPGRGTRVWFTLPVGGAGG